MGKHRDDDHAEDAHYFKCIRTLAPMPFNLIRSSFFKFSFQDNEDVTTQRAEKTKVPVTEAPVNEYKDDEYEEMDISNGSEVITIHIT